MNHAAQPARCAEIQARIIRADGTVVDLGTIAYWHINPLRRLAWRIGQALRGRRAGSVTTP